MRAGFGAPAPRRQRGVSLIEALIALLLLSIGLLGMIGLKTVGLRQTDNANFRVAAATHAADMLDRLRANPVRAAAGEYALTMADPPPATPTTIAEVDLAQWRTRIRENLPGGSGSVQVDPDGTARVEIQWFEKTDGNGAPVSMSYSFEARL